MKQETSSDVPQAEGPSECVDKNSEKKRGSAGETSDVEEKKRKKTEREEAAGETVTAEGADESEGSDVTPVEDEEPESEVNPEGPREWVIIERAREQTTNVPH